MAIESGMSPDPGQCYSLQSRLVCAKCWCEPRIVNPASVTNDNSGVLTITVECHGEKETRMIERTKLTQTQKFFEQPNA